MVVEELTEICSLVVKNMLLGATEFGLERANKNFLAILA